MTTIPEGWKLVRREVYDALAAGSGHVACLYFGTAPAAPAAQPSLSEVRGILKGYVLVPKSALEWLHGEGQNAEGNWFSDGDKTSNRYWWRSVFRRLCAAAPAAPEGAETLQEMMSRARAEPGFKEWAKTLKTPEGRAAAMAELAADCEWPLRAVGERVEPVDGKSNGFIWWESLPVGTTLYAAAPPAHTPAPPQKDLRPEKRK
jgi:hypothetical protein